MTLDAALYARLNDQQLQAVAAAPGPILVLAGPGSGKTRVLTHRVAHLVTALDVEAWRILAVTFTNKAAREMSGRLLDLVGEDNARSLTVGTFHALCSRILRRDGPEIGIERNFVIYDTADQLKVVAKALEDVGVNPAQMHPRAVLAAISQAKNELVGPEAFTALDYPGELVRRAYPRYQSLLRQAGALDFDDLLLEVAQLFATVHDVRHRYQGRYRHILVDEFQDTNTAQYAICRDLSAFEFPDAVHDIFVVGDEDQSIYSWRGADYRNVERFRRDFPNCSVVLLEQNYRSTQRILDAARAVIDKNRQRTPKRLWTEAGDGPKLVLFEAHGDSEEAAFVVQTIDSLRRHGLHLGGVAVMYRTNAQSRAVEESLVRRSVPHTLIGATRFYDRREVRDLLAFLRIIHNPNDEVALDRIINVPARGIGPVALDILGSWSEALGISRLKALSEIAGIGQTPQGAREPDSRSRTALLGFGKLMDRLVEASQTLNPPELVALVLKESGYMDWLRDGTQEGEDRWENIQEFRGLAENFAEQPPPEGLANLLESVALVADVDTLEELPDRVTLLTLHSAKGLEFDTVFLIGLEEGYLPHFRSLEDSAAVAEERRLLYVGLTRARRQLFLSHARRRFAHGTVQEREPSRFLADLPENVLDLAGASAGGMSRPRRPSSVTWDTPVASTSVAGRGDGSTVPTAATGFRAGDKVQHSKFGAGVVVSARHVGGDEEVTVAFGEGVKKLLQSYARLEKSSASRPQPTGDGPRR